jgi:hypothetical protein
MFTHREDLRPDNDAQWMRLAIRGVGFVWSCFQLSGVIVQRPIVKMPADSASWKRMAMPDVGRIEIEIRVFDRADAAGGSARQRCGDPFDTSYAKYGAGTPNGTCR